MSDAKNLVESFKRELLDAMLDECGPETRERLPIFFPHGVKAEQLDAVLALVERTWSHKAGMPNFTQKFPTPITFTINVTRLV